MAAPSIAPWEGQTAWTARLTVARTAWELWLEAERDQVGLWLPVALGTGIAAWFGLPDREAWTAFLAIAGGGGALALALGRGGRLAHVTAIFLLTAAFGCALIWSRSIWVAAPVLDHVAVADVRGKVERVDRLPAREVVRILVAPDGTSNLPRARITIDEDKAPPALAAGAIIDVRARLVPPPGPSLPGAYDFARVAWFQRIGATGKALGPVTIVTPAPPASGPSAWLKDARVRLTRHIQEQLTGSAGGIAAAFVTGDTGAIDQSDSDAMRRSGLAHLLSISGLHVTAVIAATMLVTLRLLALSQRLALRAPLVLISAGAGAFAGIFYTLLSGAEVPTVRSCVAALLVLGGLALGREAMTLRLVAAGALIVLLWRPEALVGPSFQLSFAAVASIIAFHDHPRIRAWALGREEGRGRKLVRGLISLLVTGLLVEAALAPIAAYHFHRAGVYGAFANIIAIPLSTFVIMPLEAAALLLDVIGLGGAVWWLCGKSLNLLLWLARTVAETPGAVAALPSMPTGAFLAMIGGGLWLALWRTRARLIGCIPIAVGAIWALATPAPDLLITGDGRHLAVRTTNGVLYLLRPRAGEYIRQQFGEGAGIDDPALDFDALPGARCNRDLCMAVVGRWTLLATRSAYLVDSRLLAEACARADIVVSERRLPGSCRPRWIKADAALLKQTGGLAIGLDEPFVRTVKGEDAHPWVESNAATQQSGRQRRGRTTDRRHEYEPSSPRSHRPAQMRSGDLQPDGRQAGAAHPLHTP